MSLDATLLGGVPPTGRGCYVNGPVTPGFDFYVVAGGKTSTARIVREIGPSRCWLFRGPDFWVSDPVATLNDLVIECRARGCVGVIVDAERPISDSLARALGAAMNEHALSIRVGFTSFPHWGGLRAIGATAGPNVWYSPQIYGREAQTATAFTAWYNHFVTSLGVNDSRCLLSIAGWSSSPLLSTAAGYATYLARLPAKGNGYMAWQSGTMEGWRRDALLAFRPVKSHTGSSVNRCRVAR